MEKVTHSFFSMILFAFVCTPALAGELDPAQDYEVYTLGEILISGERPSVSQITVTNEVTAEDITATNSRTAAEALSYVPGVVVTTGRKNEPEVSIRGFEQRQTLILIDGVPYYETNYGKLDLNQIPSDIIARIEVIKGAPSVLYGPNAEGGVINIVTKKATDRPTASANLEVGENEYIRGFLSHGMRLGKFNYWLNYTHAQQDAWRLSDDFDPKPGVIRRRPGGETTAILEDGGSRKNSDYTRDSIWFKFGFEPSEDSEYFMNFHYLDTEKGLPPSILENSVFLSRPAFSQLARFDNYDDWGIDLSGRQKINEHLGMKAKLFYHEHLDDYVSFDDIDFKNEIAVSRFKDTLAGGSLFFDIRPVQWDILRTAFHYKKDSHKERDDEYLPFAHSLSHTGSMALENEFNLVKNFSVTAGLSYEWFDVEKAQQNVTNRSGDLVAQEDLETGGKKSSLDPMIGAVYRFADATEAFGSIAKKTRFPTLQQLFSSKSGNPDLQEERSMNYTIGVRRPFWNVASAQAAFFHHDIEDWITRDTPDPMGIYRNYANITFTGVELDIQVYPIEDLLFKFGYTYNCARDRSEGRVTDDVVHVPEHKVDLGLQYIIPYIRTRLNFTGLYIGDTYSQLPSPQSPDLEKLEMDGYFLLNARISQSFLKHFEAYFAMNNVFDVDYEPESGFPGPGRTFWFGLTAKY